MPVVIIVEDQDSDNENATWTYRLQTNSYNETLYWDENYDIDEEEGMTYREMQACHVIISEQ